MGETPDQIRRDIEVTRAELRADANRLVDHASPRGIARRRVRGVRQGLVSMRERVMGTATQAASTVREQGHDTGTAVAERAEQAVQVVQDAPRRVARQTQGSPLAAGLIAFGSGLLLAAVLPRTDAEQQAVQQLSDTFGDVVEPARDAMAESAQHLKEDVKSSVSDAAGEVRQVASDAAQTTAEQAKDAAQDVGGHARESGQRVSGQ
ncbi:DUF3618 domain-containing protein [Lentzea kentuckyensis]|uniref:DUF3618 domain-containing protein n=1 Tax=Lentzea kentuckyensis TaxID=360086 RepID=UPI000A3960F3|nr:DUF3618 domain-containing protein [Lentzea kentuckyensis]